MNLLRTVKKLCTPAYVYLMISVVAIILSMYQNAGNTNKYCLGMYECDVSNTTLVFLGKILYVIFWTFVLNSICKAGYEKISWLLVLLPFILFFVLVGLLFFSTLKHGGLRM